MRETKTNYGKIYSELRDVGSNDKYELQFSKFRNSFLYLRGFVFCSTFARKMGIVCIWRSCVKIVEFNKQPKTKWFNYKSKHSHTEWDHVNKRLPKWYKYEYKRPDPWHRSQIDNISICRSKKVLGAAKICLDFCYFLKKRSTRINENIKYFGYIIFDRIRLGAGQDENKMQA